MERVDIEFIDLPNEHIIKPYYMYFKLFENYLFHTGKYLCEIPKGDDPKDHTLGWKFISRNFKSKVKRSAIVSVEMFWEEEGEYYRVEAEATGYSVPIRAYFKDEKTAEKLYNRLSEYAGF